MLKIVYDVEDTDISVYDILKKINILGKKVWRYNGQTKGREGQPMIYKTLLIKLQIEQHESH